MNKIFKLSSDLPETDLQHINMVALLCNK